MLCKIGSDETPYRKHTDLLCKSSAFFRKALQGNRQDAKGECFICQKELLPDVEELSHCATCGVHFHFSCQEKKNGQASPPARCPACLCDWKEPCHETQILSDIQVYPFEFYVDWLYRRRILETDDADCEYRYLDLIEAYIVGTQLEDDSFCNAVLHGLVESCVDEKWFPECDAIKEAYKSTPENCSLRKVLVQIFTKVHANFDDSFSLRNVLSGMPKEFLHDLTMALMEKTSDQDREWSLAALKEFPELRPLDDTDFHYAEDIGGQDGAEE